MNYISKLDKKVWAVIGDSITDNGNKAATKRYYDLIAEETGCIPVMLGVSGSGYSNGNGGTQQFYNRIDKIPENADIITIHGSVNDYGADFGNPSDTGTDTLAGCINTTIDRILKKIPDAHLGIMSPLPAGGEPNTPWNHTDENKAEKFTLLLETICRNRSIPFLDLYHTSNLRPWDDEFNKKFFMNGDGCHPNDGGHKLFYRRVLSFIESL